MSHDVFVSYSSKDKIIADSLVASLEQEEIRCWYAPRDIEPSADWGNEIATAIRSSAVFILIFSNNSNQSQRVLDELNLGIQNELIILPFRVQNLEPRGAMQLHLSSRHWLDAFDPTWEPYIERLVRNVAHSLQKGESRQVEGDSILDRGRNLRKQKRLNTISILGLIFFSLSLITLGLWSLRANLWKLGYMEETGSSLKTKESTLTVEASVPPQETVDSQPAIESFDPIVEEFLTKNRDQFTQISDAVYIDNNQVNCNVSRSGGEQFIYRDIPDVQGDFRFTVVGQINSWTNNCHVGVGIGDNYNEGIAINFGWFGGGCPNNGPTIVPGGGLTRTFEHTCSMGDDWPWFESNKLYRASVEIRGVQATLSVEGEKIDKYFSTNTYTGDYDVLWVGLNGTGDWPECSVTIESVSIEPLN